MPIRSTTILLLVGLAAGLAACGTTDTTLDNRGSPMEAGVFGDLRARKPTDPRTREPQGLIPVGGSGRSAVYAGGSAAGVDGTVTGSVGDAAAAADPGAYRLNFDNADIRDVVRAVLGEALRLDYTVAPDVSGTVTVSSERPVARDELLGILESVLAAQGYQLAKSGRIYRVSAISPGAGTVDVGRRTTPGYGISILPLRYVSARTLVRLLGGFVVDAEGVRVDTARNAIVVSGPRPRREDVIRTALSFDADFMADQTVGIFELKQANPEAVIAELERVFDSREAANGVIQFQPIRRLKAVLAVSKNPKLIARAETWVRRLDHQNAAVTENVFVYKARYRDARELARLLQSLFQAGGEAGSSQATAGARPLSRDTSGTGDGAMADGDRSTAAGAVAADTSGAGLAPNEPPIEDLTGASEGTNGAAPQAGSGSAPAVVDLTTQRVSTSPLRISADVANNSVITYADGDTYRRVLAALRELDTAPLQVAIQATIAEVRLGSDLRYGVQYFLKSGRLGLGEDDGSVSFQGTRNAVLTRTLPGFNFLLGTRADPDLIISALDSVTSVEILSSPSLVVLENQTAALQVGDDVPIAVSQTERIGDTAQDPNVVSSSIQYRNTGIILRVTPRIGENGAVTMKVEQEISSPAGANDFGTVFSKRSVSSQISVVSGQTVVLAGLIRATKDNNQNGLPLLNRLRGIRDVTGNTDRVSTRNELVVLIKPVVIRDGDDAQTVAEDLRSRMWAIGQRERQGP